MPSRSRRSLQPPPNPQAPLHADLRCPQGYLVVGDEDGVGQRGRADSLNEPDAPRRGPSSPPQPVRQRMPPSWVPKVEHRDKFAPDKDSPGAQRGRPKAADWTALMQQSEIEPGQAPSSQESLESLLAQLKTRIVPTPATGKLPPAPQEGEGVQQPEPPNNQTIQRPPSTWPSRPMGAISPHLAGDARQYLPRPVPGALGGGLGGRGGGGRAGRGGGGRAGLGRGGRGQSSSKSKLVGGVGLAGLGLSVPTPWWETADGDAQLVKPFLL